MLRMRFDFPAIACYSYISVQNIHLNTLQVKQFKLGLRLETSSTVYIKYSHMCRLTVVMTEGEVI